ncbi:MAG: hypothetical protein V1827_06500 [Candidatus Micrarchaeota archaeon]
MSAMTEQEKTTAAQMALQNLGVPTSAAIEFVQFAKDWTKLSPEKQSEALSKIRDAVKGTNTYVLSKSQFESMNKELGLKLGTDKGTPTLQDKQKNNAASYKAEGTAFQPGQKFTLTTDNPRIVTWLAQNNIEKKSTTAPPRESRRGGAAADTL